MIDDAEDVDLAENILHRYYNIYIHDNRASYPSLYRHVAWSMNSKRIVNLFTSNFVIPRWTAEEKISTLTLFKNTGCFARVSEKNETSTLLADALDAIVGLREAGTTIYGSQKNQEYFL